MQYHHIHELYNGASIDGLSLAICGRANPSAPCLPLPS